MDTMAVGHWLLKLLDAICSVGVCVVSCGLVHGSREIIKRHERMGGDGRDETVWYGSLIMQYKYE
jgi:hypothetical protein